METKVLSSGVRHSTLPESYVRPESERPRLSEVSQLDNVPIIDLGCEDRARIVRDIDDACKNYGFFQVTNHKMLEEVAHAFFMLPLEEKLKLFSDDPAKIRSLFTSFACNSQKSYVRPESERPRLSEVSQLENGPIIDLGCEDRARIVRDIDDACKNYGFFQATNHGIPLDLVHKMIEVAHAFFMLPLEEKLKLFSDDPAKTMSLSTSFACNSQKTPDDEPWFLDSYRITAGFGSIAVLSGYTQIKLQTTLFQSAPAIAQGSLAAGALMIISLVLLPTFPDKNLRQILRHTTDIFGSLWALLLLFVLSPIMAWILLPFWAIGAALSGKKVYHCLQNLCLRKTNPIDEATGANRAAMQQTQEHHQEQQV